MKWFVLGLVLFPSPAYAQVSVRTAAELSAALKDDSLKVAVTAAMSLGEIGPDAKNAVEALIEALKSKEVEMRGAAVHALGEIGPHAHDAARRFLVAMIDADGRDDVQKLIARADRARRPRS